MQPRPPRRRVPVPRLLLAVAGSVAAAVAMCAVPLTSASFTAATADGPNSFAAASSFCASPGSATASVTHDTMVKQESPTSNYSGAAPIEAQARTGQAHRMLMTLNVPAPPARCAVTAATITLTPMTFAAGRTIQVFRAASSFDFSTVTWNTQPATSGTPGSATSSTPTLTIDITAVVTALIQTGNTGIIVKDSAETTATTFTNGFGSLDGGTASSITIAWG